MSGDPHFDFVSCLMHFDGPNNGLRIYDEKHKAVTVVGNAKITTANSKFGGSSLYLDGYGDYIQMPDSEDWNFGALDFTIETQVCFSTQPVRGTGSTSIQMIVAQRTSDSARWFLGYADWVGLGAAPGLWFMCNATTVIFAPITLDLGRWYHVSVIRSGSNFSLYVDGVSIATSSLSITFGNYSAPLNIGFGWNVDFYLNGYLDEFRITKGIARYTTNFTPPAAPFPNYGSSGPRTDPDYDKVVLHCHFDGEPGSTTFVDQKGNALTRTAGSLSTTRPRFGGSGGDSAAFLASSSDFDLGDSDFTIEWFQGYDSSFFYDIESFSFQSTGGSWGALSYTMQYGATMRVRLNGVAVISPGTGIGANTSSMFHFAVVRQSSTLALFANGVRHGTYEIGSGAIDTNGTVRFQGSSPARFVDEFRFTKGAARYPVSSPTYAVPTEPFPDYALQKLTGTVLDDEGNPLARTVRSFRSSDGLLIDTQESDATTGAFELRATDTTPHFVVVQDPEKNALIFDHITPVI